MHSGQQCKLASKVEEEHYEAEDRNTRATNLLKWLRGDGQPFAISFLYEVLEGTSVLRRYRGELLGGTCRLRAYVYFRQKKNLYSERVSRCAGKKWQ
ncbi:hypothetical protein CALCODRAFT_498568, partial [Calocera cornea HHB12733]